MGNAAERVLEDMQKQECTDIGSHTKPMQPPQTAPDALWIRNVVHTGNSNPFLLVCFTIRNSLVKTGSGKSSCLKEHKQMAKRRRSRTSLL